MENNTLDFCCDFWLYPPSSAAEQAATLPAHPLLQGSVNIDIDLDQSTSSRGESLERIVGR